MPLVCLTGHDVIHVVDVGVAVLSKAYLGSNIVSGLLPSTSDEGF